MALLNLYREVWVQARIAFHKLALRQIAPLHEDVPYIVLTISRLTDQLQELRAKQ